MTTEELDITMAEFYETWSNKVPGKYWKLPSNKKHLLGEYLEDKVYLPMIKYDGYWARAIIGEKGVLIQSRGISKITGTYGDYTMLVPHIAKELIDIYPPGTVVLGEMCYDNDLSKKATEVGKILRCNWEKAVLRQKSEEMKLSFRVFDMLAVEYEDISNQEFSARFEALGRYTGNVYYDEVNHNENLYVNTAEWVKSGQGAELLKRVWDAGGEGIILVKLSLPYKFGGAQAWHSIKVKRSLGEIEGKVIGVLEPTREYAGRTDLDQWEYWMIDGTPIDKVNIRFDITYGVEDGKETKTVDYDKRYTPVTKPFFYGWKSGVVVEYKGRTIKMSSGTTDDDGAYLSSPAAKKLIENGSLYAVFTGMEMTPDSVRHPNLIRLRDDM